MKWRFILTCFFLLMVEIAIAGSKDTTFIKRPYYLGITCSYTDYMDNATWGTPFPANQTVNDYASYTRFYNARSIGLMIAFPFLRKWECETGAEIVVTRDWRQRNYLHYVPNTNPQEFWSSSTSRWNREQSVRLRSMFSFEFLRKGKLAVQAVGGGWYDVRGTSGHVGAESGVKLYCTPVKSAAVQVAAYYGLSKGGQSVSLRLALVLCGTRNYRVKPDKYYIRTYEDE